MQIPPRLGSATARIPKRVDQPYAVRVLREGHEPRLVPPPFVGGLALRRYRSRHQHVAVLHAVADERREVILAPHAPPLALFGALARGQAAPGVERLLAEPTSLALRRRRGVGRQRRTFRAQPFPEPYRNRALDCAADEDGHYQSVDDAGVAVVGRHVVGRGGNRWARANLLSWNGG